MSQLPLIRSTPWDTIALNVPSWELLENSTNAFNQMKDLAGHFTIKIDPLANKRLLHEFGFYYCDTLLEPYCDADRLRRVNHPDVTISEKFARDEVLAICHGAFLHGRFHRDFHLPKAAADTRYNNWLEQLLEKQSVLALCYRGIVAGFIGYSEDKLVLHALSEKYRGKGFSKYWWYEVCNILLRKGNVEVRSSISASNLAAINLYASLGFRFRNPQDVYHRLAM